MSQYPPHNSDIEDVRKQKFAPALEPFIVEHPKLSSDGHRDIGHIEEEEAENEEDKLGYVRERGEEEEISEDDNDDLLEGLDEAVDESGGLSATESQSQTNQQQVPTQLLSM